MSKILNKIIFLIHRFKTYVLFKPIFLFIGKRSVIFNPIFIGNAHRISIGKNVLIRNHARIEVIINNDEIESSIYIQDGVSIEQNFHIAAASNLIIGKNATISANVYITDLDHGYKEIGIPILEQSIKISKTEIGENCFIGLGARILAGSMLGKQCIVGANSVVRGHYPDYCVLVGIPARVVKRYDENKNMWLKTDKFGNFN